jgi:hypothetical protein
MVNELWKRIYNGISCHIHHYISAIPASGENHNDSSRTRKYTLLVTEKQERPDCSGLSCFRNAEIRVGGSSGKRVHRIGSARIGSSPDGLLVRVIGIIEACL